MIITLSGAPGAGKSTVAKMIAKELNLERIYVGGIRRELAREKGMTLEELNKYALTHPETDVDIDKEAAKKAREMKKDVLVEGRVHFHFIPESIKIYLNVDIMEGARRIWEEMQDQEAREKRNEDNINSLEEMENSLHKRIKNDTQRYMKYYGVDCYDEANYDFVIDTTLITAEQAAQQIIEFVKNFA